MVKTFGLTHVAVAVRDVDRSSKFYRGVLGAVEVYKQDGFVQLQTPGTRDVLVFEAKPALAGQAGGIVNAAPAVGVAHRLRRGLWRNRHRGLPHDGQ